MPSGITNMELLHHQTTNAKALLVALETGELRVYYEKNLISSINTDDVMTGVRFGHFGRESGTLVLAFKSGALDVKILSRNSANLGSLTALSGPPPEQDIPLKVPKKTKLYVEQTLRERESAVDMHRIFQRELYKLRLQTARTYAKVLSGTQGPISYTAGTSIRLTAQVQGIGPLFKLKINIENTGKRNIQDTIITFIYNHALYKIKNHILQIPLLVPELVYKVEAKVQCLIDGGGADPVRVFVCNSQSSLPIVTAIINMPISENFLPS